MNMVFVLLAVMVVLAVTVAFIFGGTGVYIAP